MLGRMWVNPCITEYSLTTRVIIVSSFPRKCPMLGRMWVNPCITTADDGTKNQIYLDIVDLDKNPRNRFVIILTKLLPPFEYFEQFPPSPT